MVYCSVPLCDSSSRTHKISFHQYPSEQTRFRLWIKNIARAGDKEGSVWIPNQYSVVCALHFQKSDFKEGKKLNCLKPSAVPTVFPLYPKHLQPLQKTSPVPVSKQSKIGLVTKRLENVSVDKGSSELEPAQKRCKIEQVYKRVHLVTVKKEIAEDVDEPGGDVDDPDEIEDGIEPDDDVDDPDEIEDGNEPDKIDDDQSYATGNYYESNTIVDDEEEGDNININEDYELLNSSVERSMDYFSFLKDAATQTSLPLSADAETQAYSFDKKVSLERMTELRRKYRNCCTTICRLKNTIRTLRQENADNTAKYKELTNSLETLNFQTLLDSTGEDSRIAFLSDQLKALSKNKPRWSETVLRLLIVWHSKSPISYKYVKDNGLLKLPSVSTLKRYLSDGVAECIYEQEQFLETEELPEKESLT